MAAVTVRLIEHRTFDPPRTVEIEHDGRWPPDIQRAWRQGKYVLWVATKRVRPLDHPVNGAEG